MGTVTASRILLCAPNEAAVEDLRVLLEQEGHTTSWHALDAGDPRELAAHDLVVLESGQRQQEILELCRHLRTLLPDQFVPILLIAAERNPEVGWTGLECGADLTLARSLLPKEFLASVNALLRLKKRHDRLAEKTAELARIHQQLQQSYQQLDEGLNLSRRIQQSLLPRKLPDLPPARFAVYYRPCGRAGGDSYDVFPLDAHHVGFYLADVVGHGLPASLLTIFLKQAIRFQELSGRADRLPLPHEVLQCLNRAVIDLGVTDHPFLTMVYALFDRRNSSLSFARAGHPQPIYLPRGGEPQLCQADGTLLGIFETQFTTQTLSLRRGDKLLLHTDGLDSLRSAGEPSAAERLRELVRRHARLPVQQLVDQLAHGLLEQTGQAEDFTLLGLEVRE